MKPRLVPLLALLLFPASALAQTEYVLLDCDAELRAGVLERSSRLRIARDRCEEATDGYGAWQVRLLSRNGDLVQFSTLGQSVEMLHECSAGPVALWPYVLRLYAPSDSLVPTVVEPVDSKTRDGRSVRLRPGVPVHHVKGRWYRVFAGGEQVEVRLGRKQLTTSFGDPPSGPCADLTDEDPGEAPAPRPGPAPPPARYRVPEEAAVYPACVGVLGSRRERPAGNFPRFSRHASTTLVEATAKAKPETKPARHVVMATPL